MTATTRGSPVGGNDNQGQAPDGQSQPPLQQNQTSSPDSSNENSPATPPDEQGQGDAPPQIEDEEPAFPHTDLAKLDDMINRPRWVVPVLPKGELEVLLEAAIDLSKKGLDVKSEACQRFFRDGLTISFTKILTDEAVSGWKFEIHRCIINNTHRLVELCVAKLAQDWFPLLELLAMALNPHCKFHIYNGTRPCESVSASAQVPEDELFARSPDPRSPKGWLVDLLNKFGTLNGFQILHDRFINGSALNVQIIAALIKPFGQCYEFLTLHTVKKYFLPIIEMVPQFLENLTDEELKKEAKNEAKNDALSMIIKSLKNLASRVPGQEETVKNLEIFRLKMILRLLQISSFNGKMNALNEVNKVISSVSYYTHRHGNPEEEEWLTAERMAEWIQQNNILSIVLRDSLHQPQYVEKLEKILRFVIKEKALTLEDLDNIWAAQAGKHEAIVKNVHDLLAKLAWDFSPEQLDHLFDCFKASWTNASKKQREKLLELIRRLAEDDKDGVMAHKVLNLLWNLAHSDDVPVDIMDLALSAHIKILDYSCSQDRDTQKIQWIDRFIEELRTNDKWVIPALKQIREICSLFGEAPQNLRFLLKDGQLWLCAPQAKQIWKCLAENAVYLCDREACFKWYSKLMGDEPDLDPDINKDFFESNVLQLDPSLLTENGMKCFERFFKAVNCREGKLVAKRRAYMMDDLELIGLDYLWRVVIQSNDDIASRAIDLLKEIYTNLGPRLQVNQVVIHEDFIQSCFDRLKASYDTLCVLDGDKDSINCARQEAVRMVRVLTVLREYINECDSDYHEERTILPMSRAFRGKHLSFIVRFPNQGRQVDDLEVWSHTNDTIGSVRRCILNRIKANVAHTKIELFVGGELIDPGDDRKLIGQLNLKDKSVVYALLMPAGAPLADDSSDFQFHFLKSGGLPLVLSMLTRNNFLPNADMETRRGAYLNALKIAKLLLTAIGYGHVRAVAEACQPGVEGVNPMTSVNQVTHDQAVVLQSALQSIPNPSSECMLRNVSVRLAQQISDEDDVKRTGETGIEETILEGHLGVTKELLAFQTPEKKFHIGCEKGGANLIKELIDDFIFPASNVYLQYMRNGELPAEQAIPVCGSPATINAGFELLVALAVGCVRNLKQIVDSLTEMYYIGTAITTCEALTEWEYLPPVGPRPPKGFVGLKNAGATCYMNSVIQQLYMIPSIRNGILAIEGTGSDVDDDMSGDEKQDNESNVDPRDDVFGYPQQFEDKPALSKTEDRKEYNIGVLRHLQVIFGHLAASRLQYYVPRGFWKQFRLWGEPVNLREQHDALEFFNSLVDSLDEALKALGHPAMLSKVLGGSFADQKICQGCPHRYECEESFTTLNVDIRNHQNLLDSLEQYVKGDLLEGANAYHCEKCNKKVDTVKRLLIKKLPPVLAIQLKRFDYDWERECAIKFNDYFEFPRELDMEPYTVAGVAKLEGDNVNPESQLIQQNEQSEEKAGSTKYRLVGVLVHSGQASGGHYYSYIIQRNGGDGEKNRWYKFDDGDVTECKMDDDEEMKNQCFGGEYMGEVFDHMMKRMSYRRQKRWWNAYILFYERMDTIGHDDELLKYISEIAITTRPHQIVMPSAIERSVRKQNVQFMHNRMQYSLEYFQFMKKLLTCNGVYLNPPPGVAEKTQLLKLSVPATFMLVSLDEGPGPPIKYQYAELGKLYSVVSQLIRCCNVSSRMQSSINGNPSLPNPFGDPNLSQPIMPIQQNVVDILFVRTSYVKKIIEDCSNSDETVKLLRFCCWENPQFSSTVLSELLWQVAYSYTYELRPYLDLLLQILLIEDSWQTHRIHNALKGIPDDRDGLFDTIQRSKNHYQKRAYQCIKCMVALFSSCPVAYQILQGNGDLKRKWTWAVEWLGDELERRPYTGNPQYTYNNWSPPVQSNETSNGYFLERSHSARMTLAKACELCPEEEPDDQDAPDEHESPPPEDAPLYPHSPGSQYQQNNHVHGQPYTGPAAHHMNNPQRTGQRAQENYEGSEEVSPPQTKDQ
ncbi:ubiquitin specific peptidase 9 X chromosome [Cricetulus griseus]